MAAAMKLLMLAALLRMGAWAACDFADQSPAPLDDNNYLKDSYGTCFQPRCINDNWTYKVQLDVHCGACDFGGEPLVYTFDPLKNTNTGSISNLISVDGKGEYAMTQPGFVLPASPPKTSSPAFGVTGHFTDSPAPGGACGANGYTNCIDGLIYYEKDVAVKLELVNGIIQVYKQNEYKKWISTDWNAAGSKVDMESGVVTLSGAGGEIIVVEVPLITMGGRDCTIVIGTKGLTVTLCKEDAYSAPGYPWSGIYAMTKLKGTTTSQLYGICNAWTGKERNSFNIGTTGKYNTVWQWGVSEDHLGGTARKLKKSVTGTWKV